MNGKSYASKLLEELSASLDDIEKKYTSLKKETVNNYSLSSENLEKDFDEKRNNANTQHKINELNVKNDLLRKGLSRSGESIQAKLFSSAALTGDIARLDGEEASAKALLDSEKQRDINELDIAKSEESRKLRSDIMSTYLDQLNKEADRELKEKTAKEQAELDRSKLEADNAYREKEFTQRKNEFAKEYELMLQKQTESELAALRDHELNKAKAEAEKKQREFENELELEYLKIAREKAKYDQPTEKYTPVLPDDGEIKTPSDTAFDPLSPRGLFEVILRNYENDPDRLREELRGVINDKSVSADFRYEFYNIAADYLNR
ncbi:MAG: hypothetical protein E7665_08755 [Ruminococcaceae bacterium]|nr:hypothetical protein [Oscillospiraceae bacterium]